MSKKSQRLNYEALEAWLVQTRKEATHKKKPVSQIFYQNGVQTQIKERREI